MKKIQDYNIILLVSLYINKGYFIMRKIKNELCNNRRLLSVVLAIIDVAFIALLLIGLCIGIFGKHTYNFSIEYGEEHSNKNYAQMYYAPSVEYSCAMKSHFRKFGNQMSGSGNHLCNYASLLA